MAQNTATHIFKTGDVFHTLAGITEFAVIENEGATESFFGEAGDRVSFAYATTPTSKIGTMHSSVMVFVR